jgi:creatinine amidohydrolase
MAGRRTARTLRKDELTSPRIDSLAREGPPVVFLPTGSLEQPGPHLPLGTDRILPEALALRVAERIGGGGVPTLPYGENSQPKSGGGNHMPGGAALDAATCAAVVRDLVCDFARHGLTRIVLFDGHTETGCSRLRPPTSPCAR